MKKLKNMVRVGISALLVMIFCVVPEFSVSAFSYPRIHFGQQIAGQLDDYYGAVSYQINTGNAKKIKISYSSTSKTDFYIYNSKFKTVFKRTSVKALNRNLELKKGNYIVSIYNATYNKGSFNLVIDNANAAQSIKFANDKQYLTCGNKFKLRLIGNPGSLNSVKWTSSNSKVASVNKNGVVNAKALGKANITAKSSNAGKAVCSVIVNKKTLYMTKGTTKTLPKINGARVTFKNKNKKVVRVSGKNIKAVAKGTAVLTRIKDGVNYTVNVIVR